MNTTRSQSVLPSLRLDDLLAELQVRLQAILTTRDRVNALFEAVVAVGGNLEIEVVLRGIVESAVTLVDAHYGAMGVIGEDGRLAEFIPVGVTEEQISQIHHWPEGRGLLGELITNPESLRLPDLASHPRSSGFPSGHPPMTSFLGVPIRIRDEVYGNLYLTEKRGGGEFDEEDEAVLIALAAAAGVAIENARLYDEARRQQRWLTASAEVTRSLLSGADVREALALITARSLEMSGADLVVLALPTADGSQLRYEHAAGEGAPEALGLTLPTSGSASGSVLRSGEILRVDDFCHDERVAQVAREQMNLGPAIIVPLGAAGNVRGVLTAGRRPGAMPLAPAAADMLVTFATQAGIALELAEHRRQAERVAVFEDRDRIARDLHDLVIQRLYATGMSLQGAVGAHRLAGGCAAGQRRGRRAGRDDQGDQVVDIRAADPAPGATARAAVADPCGRRRDDRPAGIPAGARAGRAARRRAGRRRRAHARRAAGGAVQRRPARRREQGRGAGARARRTFADRPRQRVWHQGHRPP